MNSREIIQGILEGQMFEFDGIIITSIEFKHNPIYKTYGSIWINLEGGDSFSIELGSDLNSKIEGISLAKTNRVPHPVESLRV